MIVREAVKKFLSVSYIDQVLAKREFRITIDETHNPIYETDYNKIVSYESVLRACLDVVAKAVAKEK